MPGRPFLFGEEPRPPASASQASTGRSRSELPRDATLSSRPAVAGPDLPAAPTRRSGRVPRCRDRPRPRSGSGARSGSGGAIPGRRRRPPARRGVTASLGIGAVPVPVAGGRGRTHDGEHRHPEAHPVQDFQVLHHHGGQTRGELSPDKVLGLRGKGVVQPQKASSTVAAMVVVLPLPVGPQMRIRSWRRAHSSRNDGCRLRASTAHAGGNELGKLIHIRQDATAPGRLR